MFFLVGNRDCPANVLEEHSCFTFSYNVRLENIPDSSKSVEIWVPLPSDNGVQQITNYRISSNLSYELYKDPEYDNQFVHFTSNGEFPKSFEVGLELDVVRSEQNGLTGTTAGNEHNSSNDLARFLKPDILVPIDGPIAEEAQQVIIGSLSPFQKIEAIYNHLFETMKYDKSGIGWGRGDALYACDARKGNCTDIHSLFIGMARSLGIPSRFIMGFPLPEDKSEAPIPGYHCWAEFYVEGQGWIPVDISEAIKHPEKKEYFFGRLDPYRVAFTTGRDIKVNSGETAHTLNYFIYPYVLVDGQPFAGATYNFSFAQKN
ncbi:MAG: transglutaminase-like domain-containing protein [Candidatus Zixiibacteriota bacterium]